MGAMKTMYTHRMFGTTPRGRASSPYTAGAKWVSEIRMHAILCNRDPDRLRAKPPEPPPFMVGGDAVPIEWRTPTVPYLYSDPDYVRAIRIVLLRDHGLEVEPDPEAVHRFAVAGLLAGEAARRIAAELAPPPTPAPEPEPERPRKLMEWAEMDHSGRFEQARLF